LEKSEGEKNIKKREEGKRKAPRVSTNKMGSQHFEKRKTFQLQNLLMLAHFLPLLHTIFKTLSKII
jgi:hypothetical protein